MNYFPQIIGGALIGLASVWMLLFYGKILGISGIVGGLFKSRSTDQAWRFYFLLGLLIGGVILRFTVPSVFSFSLSRSPYALIAAGLLVGYGTRLGNGCTSGHGVCGVSRLSPRSLMATLTFMGTGALTVFFIQHFFKGQL